MAYIGNIPTKGENNSFKLLDSIKTYTETFDGSSSSVINNGADSINVNNHRFIQGQRVVYSASGGTVITGLSDGAAYYIIKEDHNNFKLASSSGNADSGTVLPIAPAGSTTNHKLTVGFDAINTKFLASYDGGTKAQITRSAQLNISINGVVQEPQDTKTPTAGFGHDVGSVIVFSTAPDGNDSFWGNLVANNFPTFDQSDNKIDNFTGDNTTTDFSLSRTPPDNRNILVTLDGVTQHPSDASTTRAYTLAENVLSFTSAPASLVSIQVRHIGFAGAGAAGGGGGGGVTSVYGRSGAVVLKPTDNPTVGNVSAGGWLSVGSTATFDNNVTIKGVLTYDDVSVVDALGFSTFREGLRILDSKKILLGTPTAGGCQILHDSNDTFIQNKVGDLKIANNVAGDVGGDIIIQAMNGENSINCVHDAQVELSANGSKKFETSKDGVEISGVTTSTKRIDIDAGGLNVIAGFSTFGGGGSYASGVSINGGVAIGATLNVTGVSTFNTNVNFVGAIAGVTSCLWDATNNRLQIKDKAELGIGDGPDIKMYHNGAWSYIENYTGELHVKSDTIQLMSWTSGEEFIRATLNGSVDLYFDDVKRVETTGGGISVAGIVTATSFNGAGITSTSSYPNYRPILDFNFAAEKKLDSRFTYQRTGPASYIDELGKVVLVGANTPRFDHDLTTRKSKGLLVEETRTNLIPNSFDKGTWSIGSGGNTVTRNAGIAPDGTETATKVLSANNDIDVNTQLGNASAGATGQISISGGTTYTLSIWAKASTTAQVGNNFKVRWKRVQGDSTFAETTFALAANWTRYSATATTAANNTTVACYVGGVSGSEALVWGAQFEAGAFATSLISTNGSSATRGTENIFIDGQDFTDVYNVSEGTFVLKQSVDDTSTSNQWGWGVESSTNRSGFLKGLGFRVGGGGAGHVGGWYVDNGSQQAFFNMDAGATVSTPFVAAMAYKLNDMAATATGFGAVGTDTSASIADAGEFDRFTLGSYHYETMSTGHIQRVMYYPKRLPNSQLLGLTT